MGFFGLIWVFEKVFGVVIFVFIFCCKIDLLCGYMGKSVVCGEIKILVWVC